MPPTNKGVTNDHFLNGKYRDEIFHRGGSWTYHFSRKLKSFYDKYDILYAPLLFTMFMHLLLSESFVHKFWPDRDEDGKSKHNF